MDNSFKYQRIIQKAIESPWAILPVKLSIIQDVIAYRANGGSLTEAEIKERLGDKKDTRPSMEIYHAQDYGYDGQDDRELDNVSSDAKTVAVLPLIGTIIPRMDLFEESSGAVSVQKFQQVFRSAVNDPNIDSIIIDVDSPGGQVYGIEELANEIFQARNSKPIIAIANNLAASAAYWIATAASEFYVTPSGEVGSIGVFTAHQDFSKKMEKDGVKISLISSGKYKTEGNPFEELNEEAKAAIQSRVSDYYESFVNGVAKNRGVKYFDVTNGFGEGRVVGATDAVKLGMADKIGTLDDVIAYALSLDSNKIKLNGNTNNGQMFAKRQSKTPEMSGDNNGINVTTADSSKVDYNQFIISEQKGGKPMPESIVTKAAPEQPTKPEIQALELPDGTKVTAQDVQALMATVNESQQKAKKAEIERYLEAAKVRGVSPAVLRISEALLEKSDPNAKATVKLEDTELNMFGAVIKLLEIVPGKSMEEKTETIKGEKPAEVKKESVEMTLEEAEEEARSARKRLAISQPQLAQLAQ